MLKNIKNIWINKDMKIRHLEEKQVYFRNYWTIKIIFELCNSYNRCTCKNIILLP